MTREKRSKPRCTYCGEEHSTMECPWMSMPAVPMPMYPVSPAVGFMQPYGGMMPDMSGFVGGSGIPGGMDGMMSGVMGGMMGGMMDMEHMMKMMEKHHRLLEEVHCMVKEILEICQAMQTGQAKG